MENPSQHAWRSPQRLGELLNFRLQSLHAISGAPIIRMLEGKHGITRREWRLMATMAELGPVSPSRLAEVCGLDRARTSRAIGDLIAKGLLVRTIQANDTRRARVALTEEGKRLYVAIFPDIASVHTQLLSVLDDGQLSALDAILSQLTQQAHLLNQCVASDVKAQRQLGGSQRVRSLSRSLR